MLSAAGLRLTEQRKEIVRHLYVGGHRHVNAAGLHAEICAESGEISLATIYNALNDFERAGILRRIAVPCDKVWFDTDTGHHRHFYIEAEDRVIDIDEVANLSEGRKDIVSSEPIRLFIWSGTELEQAEGIQQSCCPD